LRKPRSSPQEISKNGAEKIAGDFAFSFTGRYNDKYGNDKVLMGNYIRLLAEAEDLFKRSREVLAALAETPSTETKQTTQRKKKTMTTETNSAQAGELYAAGKSVAEVASAMSVTYGKARRLIQESGVPVRDASARLKGRTRKINS
jgi:hypothetical protein